MNEQPDTYRCDICWKSYKRRAHLRRHAQSHNAERPHRCYLCHGTFQRADVLRRHLQSCSVKSGNTNSYTSRRRSCDRCVGLKKSCNSRHPCENCEKRGVDCCYSFRPSLGDSEASTRPQQVTQEKFNRDEFPICSTLEPFNASSLGQSSFDDWNVSIFEDWSDGWPLDCVGIGWQDFLDLAEDSHQTNKEAFPSTYSSQRCFEFLDEFTSRTGFISSFDCGSLTLREQAVARFLQIESTANPTSDYVVASTGPGEHNLQGQPHTSAKKIASFRAISTAARSLRSPWMPDPLDWVIHEIALLIKEVCTVKPRTSIVNLEWSAVSENACLQFFSPFNVRKFLELYWSSWHPNIPLIHRPTFDTVSCRPPLLMSMVLIGACLSPDPADSKSARIWFDCVEEVAFMDVDLSSDALSSSDNLEFDPMLNMPRVQALQAAFNVCLYQNWEGTDAGKRRIRRHRFSTVISAARDIGISNARHNNHSIPGDSFDWAEFVAREELIRTCLWVTLFDVAFVMFNNVPPRLMVKECMYQLACPEACFQAATADECAAQIRRWTSGKATVSQMRFCSALESLCVESLTSGKCRELAYLGPLNLFGLTSVIHTLIFQYQNSFGGESQLALIQNALNNWRQVWKMYSEEFSQSAPHAMVTNDNMTIETMWKRVGFMRHAPEFWLLTSVVVNRIKLQKQKREPQHGDSVVSPDPILQNYDQTSMQQVNDLISDFKKIQIQ